MATDYKNPNGPAHPDMSQAPPQYGNHGVESASSQAYPQQQPQTTGITSDPYAQQHPVQQPTPAHTTSYGEAEKYNHNTAPGAQPSGYYNTNNNQNVNPNGYTGATQAPPQGGRRNGVPISSLSSAAAPVDCPSCHQVTVTRTQMRTGNTTNAWAAGLCITLCLGCIPYCISSTKDVAHNCGNCGAALATWHRSGRTEVHMHA